MPQGVYLDSASTRFPLVDRDFDAFAILVELPDEWQSVSIGRHAERQYKVIGATNSPYDHLYSIAGPFSRHSQLSRKLGETPVPLVLKPRAGLTAN